MYFFDINTVEESMNKMDLLGQSQEFPEADALIDLDDINFELEDSIDFEAKDAPAPSMPDEIDFDVMPEPREPTYTYKYGPESEPYREFIEQMEEEHDLPKGMLPNLIGIESSWNPNIVSKRGAGGLMQLMPDTAAMLGVKDVFDPYQNIEGGVAYLKKLKKRFGTWEQVWIAYNMGPTALAEGRALPKETLAYVKKMKGFQAGAPDIPDGSVVDFESDAPIQLTSPREPPGIYMPKEQSLYDKFRNLITDPGLDKGKAANIMFLSDTYGLSPSTAEKHYDELKKLIFEGTQPTSRDVAGGLMGAAVTTGIIFNPIATAVGVGTFMGLDELENYIISRVEDEPHHFLEGKGISDLLDAHGLSEDAIDLLDFAWKMPVAGGTTKFGRGMMGSIATRVKGSGNKVRFINKVAEDVKTEGVTPDEAAIKNAGEFGIDKDQLLEAQRDKDVKVEQEVEAPENPLEITRPSEAIPTHTFTSNKGHFYEKIGETWYDGKGKAVTNPWIIKAAEKKKVNFEKDVDVEVAEEEIVEDIEEQTGKRIEEVTDEEIDKYYDEKEEVVDTTQERIEKKLADETPYQNVKPEAQEVFDALDMPPDARDKLKRKRKIRVIETNVKDGEPIEIPPTWHDGVFRYTAMRTPEGEITAGEAGSYDTIMMPGAVAGAKEGPIPPGHTLYLFDTGVGTDTLRIYRAAESTLPVEYGKPTTHAIKPEEKEAVELFYDRRLNELSDEEVELFLEDHRAGKLGTDPEVSRFFQDEKTTEQYKGLYADSSKAVESDPELLTKKLVNDVNRWYKGDDSIDVDTVRNTLDVMRDRADDLKPGGKKEYFGSDENHLIWKNTITEAAKWARALDSPKIKPTGGTKLYSGIPADAIAKSLKRLHPAAFPRVIQKVMADIAEQLKVKEVLDIFGGIGNIGKLKKYGFKGTIMANEIEPNWRGRSTIDIQKGRGVDIAMIGDSRDLDIPSNSVQSIFTSPTYGNLMALKSPSKTDSYQAFAGGRLRRGNTGGEVWGPEYERLHREIYEEAHRVVEPGGFFVLNMKDKPVSAADAKNNWIPKKGSTVKVVDQVMKATDWHIKALEDAGFDLISRVKVGEPRKVTRTQKLSKSVGYEEVVVLGKRDVGKKGTTLYSGAGYLDKAAKKIFDKLKRTPKPTNEPPEPFSIKSQAKEIILTRRANLNLANYDTNKFINKIEQKLNLTQREAMPFVIEGTDVPKELGRPDLNKVISKNKELLKGVAAEVKQHFEEGWRKTKQHIPNLSVKQIEEYVTHLWDIPRHKRAEAVSWFQTQNRFLEKRFIDTYKEGIEKGFKPKVLDISEIIRTHDTVSNRSIENVKYVKSLLNLRNQGIHLIQRTGTAPLEWIEVNYPALTRRIPLTKKVAGKKGEFVKELKVRVHPDLVRPLKAIFEQRFDHPVISAYEAINGLQKKTMLSISLFHHGALGETGVALIGLGKTAKIMFDPVRIYKALARGEYDIFSKEPIARDSIEHGVQYGATADIPISKIQGYLDSLARNTENTLMLNRITKMMKDFNKVWDKALWNYLHDTLKLYGYESLVSKLDPNMGPEATKMAKREIGQLVNDTFGGQNWDTLMMTPKEVQMLTWSLLSSDWTFSTTRQALAPTGIGAVYKESAKIRRKAGRRFWFRAGLYFGVGINALNAMFRTQDMKENPKYYRDKEWTYMDKTMFGNTIGKKTKLFVGRYKDGTERYLKWGKQFIDFYELVSSPLKKIGGKAAPVPQLVSEIFTGHSLSGFKNDDIYGKKGFDMVSGIFKTVVKAPLPFALRRLINEGIEFKPTDIFMPSSKGMSRYRALEYFKAAIVDQDMDLLRETYEGALRNNLPAYTLFSGALSWTENEIMAEVNRTIVDIRDAEMKLRSARTAYDRRRYGTILKRLHKEKADKQAGFKLFKTAVQRSKVYIDAGGGQAPRLP